MSCIHTHTHTSNIILFSHTEERNFNHYNNAGTRAGLLSENKSDLVTKGWTGLSN